MCTVSAEQRPAYSHFCNTFNKRPDIRHEARVAQAYDCLLHNILQVCKNTIGQAATLGLDMLFCCCSHVEHSSMWPWTASGTCRSLPILLPTIAACIKWLL